MPRVEEFVRSLLRPLYRRLGAAARRYFPSQADNLAWNRKMAESYVRKSSPGSEPLGQEWGAPPQDVDQILESFLFPFVGTESIVAEIGVGGGRIAARVAPRVARFYGFDISPAMLRAAHTSLGAFANVELTLLREPKLPEALAGSVDFIYSFATFLHLDLHLMRRYFEEMAFVLRPGGHAFVHVASVTTPDGWARFASQDSFSVFGFYFVSPELVQTLAGRMGFSLVKGSQPDPNNAYLNRDYFAVFRR
jgi:SAM-dependent methyltransferase